MRWSTFLVALLLAMDACSPKAGAPSPVTVREIRVRVACDEECRAEPDWERVARRRMKQASGVYERRFGIRWSVVDVVHWTSDDEAASLGKLLDQLEKDVPRTGVDEVVGFTGQTRAQGTDRNYELRGKSRPVGPVAVVISNHSGAPEDWIVGSIVHELGHALGMWHCVDPRFVMHTGDPPALPLEFDPQSAAVIDVTRDLDFARGAEWLDETRRRRIDEIFRAGHAPDATLPYVAAESEVAWRLVHEGDVPAGRALYERALSEQAHCMGDRDPTLLSCLTGLAWADLRDPGEDVNEAEQLARQAHAIVLATRRLTYPLLEEEWILAEVAWARGRREEAIAACRKVFEARLRELGPSSPDVADVKEALDRKEREAHPPPQPAAGK